MAAVTRIDVVPVKRTQVQTLGSAYVSPHGVVGDRAFVVVEESGALPRRHDYGLVRVQSIFDTRRGVLALRFPNGERVSGTVRLGATLTFARWDARTVEGRVVLGDWSEALSRFLGSTVKLVRVTRDLLQAAEAVTLVSAESIARVAREAGVDSFDPRRLRLNLTLAGFERPHAEDALIGRRIRIGETELELTGAVPRCAWITRHPVTGVRDLDLLRAIRSYRAPVTGGPVDPAPLPLGVYASVVKAGALHVGAKVEVV